jgi:hypothetical protein
LVFDCGFRPQKMHVFAIFAIALPPRSIGKL